MPNWSAKELKEMDEEAWEGLCAQRCPHDPRWRCCLPQGHEGDHHANTLVGPDYKTSWPADEEE